MNKKINNLKNKLHQAIRYKSYKPFKRAIKKLNLLSDNEEKLNKFIDKNYETLLFEVEKHIKDNYPKKVTFKEYSDNMKNLHTKKLLTELDLVRAGHEPVKNTNANDRIKLMNIIKEELSIREHIPNKKEAKEIRQEKAKQKSSS